MESLQELVKLVTQKRIKKIELFDESSRNKSSNYFKLFEGIHSSRYQTDEEAAADIYQCSASEKKYLILKTRLKQKLLNTLFFLDVEPSESISEHDALGYEMRKSMFQAQVLLINGMHEVGVMLLEKLLRRVQELKISEVEWETAEMLRQHYAEQGKYKTFLQYKQIAEDAKSRTLSEKEMQTLYEDLNIHHKRLRHQKTKLMEYAKNIHTKAEVILDKHDTKLLKYYYLKIKNLFHVIHDEHNEALRTIEEQMDYLGTYPTFKTKHQLEFLTLNKGQIFLHQKDFQEGEDFSKKQQHIEEGTNTWFTFQENRFLLAMHSSQFLKAGELFQQALGQNTFRLLPEKSKQRWFHFQAYLHYIYKSDKMKELRTLTQNSKIPFKLGEYFNILPKYSKANAGINTSILTAQVLFLLERLDVDESVRRIEMLQNYTRHYPKKDGHYRREIFIKMLKELYQQDFRFFQTNQNTEKDFLELQEVPMDYRGSNQFIEILPYEMIWQRILEKMKQYRYG